METRVFYYMISIHVMMMKSKKYLESVVRPCTQLLHVLRTLLTMGCRCICNTSGSGKTRRILEGLTRYWGFYLVAIPDTNGVQVGIGDMLEAFRGMAEDDQWISDLTLIPSEQRARQHSINISIASMALRKVLAARTVVFEQFLKLAIEIHGDLQEKHKRIWLLFQLSDQLDPRSDTTHPFVRIMRNCLDRASTQVLKTLIGRLDNIRDKYLSPGQFIIGLDEAQRASRLYPRPFISSKDNKVYQSILRAIAAVFTEWSIKLVVSGTGVSLAELGEDVASGVSKPMAVHLFHKLGMFDTWLKLNSFLRRYVPASILESPSGHHLQLRIQEHLLGRWLILFLFDWPTLIIINGRYHFSVSFLELFLLNGLESPHTLLNEYIKAHTTCYPGDTGLPFTLQEPKLCIKVQLMSFEWDRLEKGMLILQLSFPPFWHNSDPNALSEAAQIVQSHLTQGTSPPFGPVTVQLVEYGIACRCDRETGQIIEPLAFVSPPKRNFALYLSIGWKRYWQH